MNMIMVVGTYTGSGSEGVYSYAFDSSTGDVSPALDCAPLCNPSYIEVSPDGRRIYAVTEVSDERASLTAYSVVNGRFRKIGSQPSVGSDPCHVAVGERMALTANYSGSLSAFQLRDDGAPMEPSLFHGSIGGPDLKRQATPHIHCAMFSPDGKYVFASDFSADRLLRYDISANGSALEETGISFPTPPDTGPRHFVFDRDGSHLYLLGELSGAVSVYGCENGILTLQQTIVADRVRSRGAGDVHLSPDGSRLYASCRLRNDGIATFEVNSDGSLRTVGYTRTGLHPRNFNITPDGKMMLVACRDSDCIEIYGIDSTNGLPTGPLGTIPVSKPVCIKFIS